MMAKQGLRMRGWLWGMALALVGLLGAAAAPVGSSSAGLMQAAFINVGQGDAALLQDGSGTDVLIDGGPVSAGVVLVAYLRDHTDHTIDVVLVTHADADHSGGVVSLLQANDLAVGTIYTSGYPGSTQTWADLVSLAGARSIPITAAQFPGEYSWGQFKVYILNPAAGLINPAQNDAAVVARIDYQANRFLFPADIDASVEASVVARQTPVAADVLKVGHHGSATSSSAAFLAAVNPAAAVISVGTNSYGHPAAETLARLADAGIAVWRTDQRGTVLIRGDGSQLTFPGTGGNLFFLAMVAGPVPTLIPTMPPVTRLNEQCTAAGAAVLCAWVSNASPARGSSLTVYTELRVDGLGQAGLASSSSWHYKTTTASCAATTDSSGLAACTRSIGQAAAGYRVDVDVSVGGYSSATWFTPQ